MFPIGKRGLACRRGKWDNEGMDPNKPEFNRQSDGTFGAGNIANPTGRPRGKTIKERVREWLETHPEDMQKFVDHFVNDNKELAWQMMEGKPKQQMEVDVDKDTLGELTEFFKAMAK